MRDCRSEECQRALTQSTCNAGGGWTDLLDEKEFEISQLRFDWLKAGKGLKLNSQGILPHISIFNMKLRL